MARAGRPCSSTNLVGYICCSGLCDRYGPGFGVPAVFPFTSFEVVTDWVSVFVGALIPPGVIIMCRVSRATGAFAGFCWHNLQCRVVTAVVPTIYDSMAD